MYKLVTTVRSSSSLLIIFRVNNLRVDHKLALRHLV